MYKQPKKGKNSLSYASTVPIVVQPSSRQFHPYLRRLYSLCTPAAVSLPHILGWLDTRDELENHVCYPDDANDRSENDVYGVVIEEDRTSENVESSSANERKQERSIARNLWRNLELKKSDSKTKHNNVNAYDN